MDTEENLFYQPYWNIRVYEDNRFIARFSSLWQAENFAKLLKEQKKDWKKKSSYRVEHKGKTLVSL